MDTQRDLQGRNEQEVCARQSTPCVEILTRLLESQKRTMDRAAVRRAVSEAITAWPGDVSTTWWRWLVEAARSLDMELTVLDVEPLEMTNLVLNRECVATYLPQQEAPWLIAQLKRRRVDTVRFTEKTVVSPKRELLSAKQFERTIRHSDHPSSVRCVVSDPVKPVQHPEHAGLSPLDRLVQLVRPEWPDIWVVLVFAMIVGLLTLATPVAVEALVNTVAFGRFLQPVLVLALMLFAFLAFSAAIRVLQTFVVEIIQRRLFVRIAGELARRLPRVQVSAFDDHDGPELVNRFFDVVTVQKAVAGLLLDAVVIVLGTFVGMAVLAFYHPWLLGFDVVLLAMIGVIVFGLGRGAVKSAVKESKRKYYIAEWFESVVSCRHTFRYGGGRQFAIERSDLLVSEYLEDRRKHFKVLFRQIAFALTLQAITSTALLGLGGWLVIQGQLTLGQLVAAELIVAVIVGAFAKLGKHLESFYDLLAAVDKIGILLDLPLERRDGLLLIPHSQLASVHFSDVSHKYASTGRGLKPFSADVRPGESMAIFGERGSGKSTLGDLLFGLRAATSGRLEIDGFNPRDIRPDVFRHHVALVRDPEIFTGPVTENVHLERTGVTTTDVKDALRLVGIYEEVLSLPDSLETKLTPNGLPLTQRQSCLLALARAIAGRPKLLVIDGILDTLSSKEIEQFFERLSQKTLPWTLIILTARREIADRCQNVTYLEEPKHD
ncbi:peptidase domain-containing ABC transporter [Thalassoroseus pseudoceratinae]|uniref:peptidase domain-containing ABC transporter n=1 Tax=Thalassoroseus pseudoceratinae TaxID=2713176 RepID=UPI00198224EF|nr:ATP-binding cassette domain-containing protein [Thalassoroseus pseudoceratinae]